MSRTPVSILNPEHLFQQGEKLIAPPAAGPPRQADLRRAISGAYYGVFHATLAAAADEFVGRTKRADPEYALVYRKVDHRAIADLCSDLVKRPLSVKYTRYLPTEGLDVNLLFFAEAFVGLQRKRLDADYNPHFRPRTADARFASDTARAATRRLEQAAAANRRSFLSLLLFPPRQS